MWSPTEQPRAGFALMEAVMALAIIGMVAIGLLGATAAQVRTADKAALLVTARALAEDRMAMLRTLDWDGLGAVPDSLAAGVFPPPLESFGWTARVDPVRDEYDLFAAEVVVHIHDEAFILRTLLHEPQPLLQAAGTQERF
jgi:type II secretory pathway pseudopilin PulG